MCEVWTLTNKSIEPSNEESVKYPAFDTIIQDCKKKIESKFTEYGNSWINQDNDKFWIIRLKGEVDELVQRLDSLPYPTKRMSEAIDIINICAMIYTKERFKIMQYNMMGRHGD